MPVSPRDFELYSRMTGAPMPSDAMSRMQMAPEVYEFTKNFARRPNLLQQTGNLLKNIGKGAVMAIGAPMIAESLAEQARIDEELRNEKDKIEAEAVTTNNSEVEDSPAMKKIRLQMEADALKHQYKLELQDRMDARALGKSTGGSGVVQTDLNPLQESGPKPIGKTPDGQLLYDAADLSTQPSTTANNYSQRVITSSTSQNILDKQLENYEQMRDNIPNVAEVLATSEESQPAALYGTNPLDVPLLRSEDYGSGITSEQRIEFSKRNKLDKALKGVLGENIQQGNSSDEYIPVRRNAINTGATVNLNPRRQEIENNVRKNLATLTPDQQAKVVDKIISGENIQQGNSSDEYIPVRRDTNTIMNTKKTSPVKSMTPNFDMSKNSTPTVTLEMKQKGGSTKPYTFGLSTPMAVSLNEMIEDGSIKDQSFGELANLMINENIGIAFNPYDQ